MALLLALGIVVSLFPVAGETKNQIASSDNAKIGLNDEILKVNAAASLRTIKKSKTTKYKKVKAKKVKIVSKKVKVRYYYRGKWRTKWVYKPVSISANKPPAIITSTQINTNTNTNTQTNSNTVTAEGKCSCSLYADYNVHTGTWVNYCPYCSKYGTLTYTNQQGCPEGMFYCDMSKKGCDADFCIVHGKAHTHTNVKFLTPA